jgi:hypothetical protein
MMNKLSLTMLIFGNFAFGMERPRAIGQHLQRPTMGQAVKDCCCDPYFLSKCAVIGGLLYKSTNRYLNITELIAKTANAPATLIAIQQDQALLIGTEILVASVIGAHYLDKHLKVKTE